LHTCAILWLHTANIWSVAKKFCRRKVFNRIFSSIQENAVKIQQVLLFAIFLHKQTFKANALNG
jgi:hypothetical protein